jgi:hypothetical protein
MFTGQGDRVQEVTMKERGGYWSIDLLAVAAANLMNVVMVAVFLLRTMRVGRLLLVGLLWVALIVLLAIVVILNIRVRRRWWAIVLPALLAMFLAVEVALDYVARVDFRSTWVLGPYLFLYYASILGMIGYSFLAEKRYGFTTLATYFLSQIAALYSYLNVGHG